ncbi:MAG: hypothetical protein R6U64_10950 [Bacteroidales bacterium]
MKRFDDHFADNVREVFDHYHEEVDSEAFAAMQQQLQQRKRRRVIVLFPGRVWAGIAASVMLVATGWLVWQNMPLAEQRIEPQVVQAEPVAPVPEKQKAGQGVLAEKELPAPVQQPEKKLVAVANGPAARENSVQIDPVQEHPVGQLAEKGEDKNWQGTEIPSALPQDSPAEVVLPVLRSQGSSPAAAFMAAKEDPMEGYESGEKSGHSWSVAAGSMLAFARQGISDGLGMAAGVVSEWKVAPGVTLTAGGLLTYHQFELVSLRSRGDFYDYAPGPELSGDMMVPRSSSYELLALDIPLNAQFDVAENDKRRFYLSAGLSSILFLQEHFRDNQTLFSSNLVQDPATGEMVNRVTSQVVLIDEKTGAFSRFDAARLFNVSFGYVIKGTRGSTIIEPFLKVPLSSITSRELNLGMGGITLRYNFQKK